MYRNHVEIIQCLSENYDLLLDVELLRYFRLNLSDELKRRGCEHCEHFINSISTAPSPPKTLKCNTNVKRKQDFIPECFSEDFTALKISESSQKSMQPLAKKLILTRISNNACGLRQFAHYWWKRITLLPWATELQNHRTKALICTFTSRQNPTAASLANSPENCLCRVELQHVWSPATRQWSWSWVYLFI